jgi:hypothetical protein
MSTWIPNRHLKWQLQNWSPNLSLKANFSHNLLYLGKTGIYSAVQAKTLSTKCPGILDFPHISINKNLSSSLNNWTLKIYPISDHFYFHCQPSSKAASSFLPNTAMPTSLPASILDQVNFPLSNCSDLLYITVHQITSFHCLKCSNVPYQA